MRKAKRFIRLNVSAKDDVYKMLRTLKVPKFKGSFYIVVPENREKEFVGRQAKDVVNQLLKELEIKYKKGSHLT